MKRRAAAPRAVVFDLDGTLLDSLPLVLAAITHAVEPFGARPTKDIFARLGGPPDRFLPAMLSDVRHLPVAMDRMARFHSENTHLMRPFAGATAFLAEVRAAGLATAVWTGRDRISTELLMRHFELRDLFDHVVCGDDLPTHKPDPAGLREIIRRFGLSAAELMYVGDADVDVLGGVACGVDTILIRHEREIEPEIAAVSWRVVASPAEAYAAIGAELPPPR